MNFNAKTLLFILAPVVLLPLLFVLAYVWQAGLDLHSPANARQWVKVCARSREDLYCKAAARVLRGTSGPIVFLHPNKGDHEITADLIRWKGHPPTREEAEAVARANLFAAPQLREGWAASLDGQRRQVKLSLPESRHLGQVGQLRFGLPAKSAVEAAREGTVYLVTDPAHQRDFFLPAE